MRSTSPSAQPSAPTRSSAFRSGATRYRKFYRGAGTALRELERTLIRWRLREQRQRLPLIPQKLHPIDELIQTGLVERRERRIGEKCARFFEDLQYACAARQPPQRMLHLFQAEQTSARE